MEWKKYLKMNAFKDYWYTRSYLRLSLSEILNVSPLKIPLKADPGKAPLLESNNGYISISHTNEVIFFAWAPLMIGIDIEKKDRIFAAEKLTKRFFMESEKIELMNIDQLNFRKEVLKYWIVKEASYKWQMNKKKGDFFNWEWVKSSSFSVNKKLSLKVKTYFHEYGDHLLGIAYNDKF